MSRLPIPADEFFNQDNCYLPFDHECEGGCHLAPYWMRAVFRELGIKDVPLPPELMVQEK